MCITSSTQVEALWNNNCSEEIRRCIGKAAGTMASLRHLWNSKKITIQNKLRILTTCVFSVLLYASETWTLKEIDKKKLLEFEMKCYPENIKNKLKRHDKERRHTKDNSERRNNHTHYKETKAKAIRAHM